MKLLDSARIDPTMPDNYVTSVLLQEQGYGGMEINLEHDSHCTLDCIADLLNASKLFEYGTIFCALRAALPDLDYREDGRAIP